MPDAKRTVVIAALEHLSGPAKGETSWVVEDETAASLDVDRRLALTDVAADGMPEDAVAMFTRKGGAIDIRAVGDASIWLNGERISGRALRDGDVIEFCDAGPLSRMRLYRPGSRQRHTIPEVFTNVIAYMRASRRPLLSRTRRGLGLLLKGLAYDTSVLFRGTVLLAIFGLGYVLYEQDLAGRQIALTVADNQARMQSFSAALARARDEALSEADLRAIRQDVSERMAATSDRVTKLEALSRATATVIAASRQSVTFLQGSYGFRERKSGRMLRHAVDAAGRKLSSPLGQPLLTLDGDGPVAERQYTGTGFLLADGVSIVTNRHVALPWEKDASAEAMQAQGLEPLMIRLAGYFPQSKKRIAMELLGSSDDADLSILKALDPPSGTDVVGLKLAERPPAPGESVIVLGYPTGLRALLARTGPAFVEALQADGVTDFWEVATRLAAAGHIAPLASGGIVGQATSAAIVYDAETTHGGSGGPVLNANGEVVAVNTAILPEYGGSNLGVPTALLRRLLAAAPHPSTN